MLLTQQVALELQARLAHTDCNTGIGYFRDDLDLLELAQSRREVTGRPRKLSAVADS